MAARLQAMARGAQARQELRIELFPGEDDEGGGEVSDLEMSGVPVVQAALGSQDCERTVTTPPGHSGEGAAGLGEEAVGSGDEMAGSSVELESRLVRGSFRWRDVSYLCSLRFLDHHTAVNVLQVTLSDWRTASDCLTDYCIYLHNMY